LGAEADYLKNDSVAFDPEFSSEVGVAGGSVGITSKGKVEAGVAYGWGAEFVKDTQTFVFTDETAFYELWNELKF